MEHYVASNELESDWANWLESDCQRSWDNLSRQIYSMCQGISIRFRPKTEDEHEELTHEAFVATINKIKLGKLRFIPGKAPVFNLLTTAIFRYLYSLKNRNKRGTFIINEYAKRCLMEGKLQDSPSHDSLHQADLFDTNSFKYYDQSETED